MKVLHIISQTPDFTGSGKFIREIIKQSSKKGHENFLIAGAQKEFVPEPSLASEDKAVFIRFDGEDLAFPIPGMSDVMPYPSSVFSKLGQAQLDVYTRVFKDRITDTIERFKPDILHTHHLWIVSAIARSAAPGIPMITTCHGTCLRQHHLCPDISKKVTGDLKKIDRVIALSSHQQENISSLLDIGKKRIPIISGGYNDQCFYNSPKVFEGTVELLYAGKLSSAKGVPWLLKTLERIKELPFRLHMAGSSSGPEQAQCLSLAEKLGKKAVYHGPLSHEELSELMRKAHIFILPSFYEGMPLVLMEALACGCRIVTTALPGVMEIFKRQQPEMVRMIALPPLKDIDSPYEEDEEKLESMLCCALEETIASVIKNPQPDLSYVRQTGACFTWEKIFSNIEDVYMELI